MKRSSFIDIIKGVSILLVVWTHFDWRSEERQLLLFPFWVQMAVPFFMIVSGYVYTKSFNRKNVSKLHEAYAVEGIIEKWLRYTVPFAVMYSLEMFLFDRFGIMQWLGWQTYFDGYAFGGYGQGSYYYPIMLQFIFLFPLIYFIIRRFEAKGLILCFAFNIVYEFIAYILPIDGQTYRLQIYRYTFLISFGCYIAHGGGVSKAVSAVMVVLGLVFTYLFSYGGYTLFIPNTWASTSLLPTLFILPVFNLLSKSHFKCKPLELLGKASYNIFLVQMVWYRFNHMLEVYMPSRRVRLPVSMIFCVVIGIGFYYLETPVTKWCIEKSKRLIAVLEVERT